jgi:hypothetical protein
LLAQYISDVHGNTVSLFTPWNHTTMFVVTSWLSATIMIVGIVADQTVVALDACDDTELSQTFRCNPREVPKALAHINVKQEPTKYYAGLWTGALLLSSSFHFLAVYAQRATLAI